MEKQLKEISKLLSLVLRHQPEYIGIKLDENGWISVEELLQKINQKGIVINLNTLQNIVDSNEKKRFAFNENQSMIRAQQGHSIYVDLGLQRVMPPDVLYHGTTQQSVESILRTGILKQARHHVHLSVDIETAKMVGSRHGKPAILSINAKEMSIAGHAFYLSGNAVWLVDMVPAQYISL